MAGSRVNHHLGAATRWVPGLENLQKSWLGDGLGQITNKNRVFVVPLRRLGGDGRAWGVRRRPIKLEKSHIISSRNGLPVKHFQHFVGILKVVESNEAVSCIGQSKAHALLVSDELDRMDEDFVRSKDAGPYLLDGGLVPSLVEIPHPDLRNLLVSLLVILEPSWLTRRRIRGIRGGVGPGRVV
ncbi:hypothetical protein OGAPHI_000051 [Ogataea philodendri]|uniref:Uncharacterized protein n=1 Tax=Ogataea philodendri TaxID=1378263 RepID=A0A9P8PHR5_9ASCO|nr:uncharacterized protein OGAPHI_000051 [Ogataea philodendri]KAH3671865.1 hypothetical protein OGAPHI_000051 [Ogataea philodendri]